MRTLLCWLLLSAMVAAEAPWERSLRQILADANGRQPVPKGTTNIPVEDQIQEEEDPGAAVPS